MKSIKKLNSLKDLRQAIDEQVQARKSEKKSMITVSAGTCGQARGSLQVIEALEKVIKKENLEKKVRIKVSGCHGFCEAEPNIIIKPQEIFYQKVQAKDANDIILQTVLKGKIVDRLLYQDPARGEKVSQERDIPFYKKQMRLILEDNALIDPTDINDYLSIGGYGSLLKVLSGLTPEEIIEIVKKSGLRGRGGAGPLL